MTQDKINLKRAMDALNQISLICDHSSVDAKELMEAMVQVENIANRAIRVIICSQRDNPHMGAPGGDRSLLPECQCCGERMIPDDNEYYCVSKSDPSPLATS